MLSRAEQIPVLELGRAPDANKNYPSRLQEPAFCQRGTGLPDDEVIEHPDVDQVQGVFQATRDGQIALAGFADATGMVVVKNGSGGVISHDLLDDFARMDAGPVDSAAEQFLDREDAVSLVEPDHPEDLVLKGADSQLQIAVRQGGRGQRLRILDAPQAALQDGGEDAPPPEGVETLPRG